MGGQPLDSPPPEWSDTTHAGWNQAVADYQEAEAEFTRWEDQVRPQWAEESSHPVE